MCADPIRGRPGRARVGDAEIIAPAPEPAGQTAVRIGLGTVLGLVGLVVVHVVLRDTLWNTEEGVYALTARRPTRLGRPIETAGRGRDGQVEQAGTSGLR